MGLPLFSTALGYSLVYALGFVLIHVTGSKLATKQPAMTASKLAKCLDEAKEDQKDQVYELALMIKSIHRSQFVAFLGNVILSFPIALGLCILYQYSTSTPFVSDIKAYELIQEINIFESPALFYAAIAGIFLFLSGIISGYYQNLSVAAKFPERLILSPFLRWLLPVRRLHAIGKYLEGNIGQIIGNVALGFMLGTASTFGEIFGLPLDIRHITFSAGNIGIAFAHLYQELTLDEIKIAFFGIVGIGLMNFIFSFTPSLIVAIKSRSVSFKQYPQLLGTVLLLMIKSPASFFVPTGKEKISFFSRD
jgi:site-specific recombinase